MTWKQTAIALFCLYVVSMLGMSAYVEGITAANADLRASLDLVYSQLPDPHETAFGE